MKEMMQVELDTVSGGVLPLVAYYWEYDPRDPRYTGQFGNPHAY
jgi:hypothetical protein